MTVRLGLVGTSWWADFMYVPSIRSHPGATLSAVCGTNPERTAAFAQQHGVERHYTDYRRMFADGALDAVIVATPDDTHKAIALAGIDAGLHVLCEKPLANTVADAQEMLDRAEAANIRHMVLYTWRWQPVFQYLKALIDDGYIGRPYRAHFGFIGSWGLQPTYQWRQDGDRANGVLGDLGSHMIDMGHWMIGRVASVSAHAPVMIDRTGLDGTSPRPVNDTAHLTLEYANGAQGTVDVSVLTHRGDSNVRLSARIDGSGGSVEVEFDPLGPNAGYRMRGMRLGEEQLLPLTIPPEYLTTPPEAHLDVYVQHRVGTRLFVDAISEGFQPEPGFEAAVATQRVIDAALRSHAERRWIDVV